MIKVTFGPMLLALALFTLSLLISIGVLFPLVSDKKIGQAATSLQEEKIQSMFYSKKC